MGVVVLNLSVSQAETLRAILGFDFDALGVPNAEQKDLEEIRKRLDSMGVKERELE